MSEVRHIQENDVSPLPLEFISQCRVQYVKARDHFINVLLSKMRKVQQCYGII